MATLRILLTLSIVFCFPITPAAIPTGDLDAFLLLLRGNGHSLFANAISTSDLLFDLLSLPSLTLFAPTDPALFAVDMIQTPPLFLSTLRLHALPLRLSWSNLLQLPENSSFSTLLNSRDLLVTRGDFGSLLVGGVQVVMPGLYYSNDVAVHGLDGILTFRSLINHPNATVFFPTLNHTTTIPHLPQIPRIPTLPNHPIVSPLPAPRPAALRGYSPAESPDSHGVLTGKPIKLLKSKQKNRTHSTAVNGTVLFPPVAKNPRTSTNRRNRTDSTPSNGTISSSPVNHTIVSPPPGILSSCPIDRTVVASPPVLYPAPEPSGPFVYSAEESQEDRNVFVSPPVLTPAPGAAFIYGYSRDFFTGDWSASLLWSETSPSPALMRNDFVRSRKVSEVFVDGEICTVG